MYSSLSVSWYEADVWPLMFVCVSIIDQTNVGEGKKETLIQAVSGQTSFSYFVLHQWSAKVQLLTDQSSREIMNKLL